MFPTINIGSAALPSWHVLLLTGAVVSTALCVYLRPHNFIVSRLSLFNICVMLFFASLFGARLLFILSNLTYCRFTLPCLMSGSLGFSYCGALAFSGCALYVYAKTAKKNLAALVDYGAPFFLISQVFVRIGCLMAGCCYGKPMGYCIGINPDITIDVPRYPVQFCEAILLLLIYIIARIYYAREKDAIGRTSFFTLLLYGTGRFFIEFLRANEPVLFMNITFTQIVCLLLIIGSAIGMSRVPDPLKNPIAS